MHKHLIIALLYSFLSCANENNKKSTITTEKTAITLEVDHFNIWVTNPKKAKEKLAEIGFTSVPDSLSQIHHGQGTAGRYFYFLNSYLELIFVNNQKEFEENNKKNKDLDFNERSNFENNGASPFSIALKLKDYKVDKIPFKKIKYHQEWMGKNNSIFSAKNSKTQLLEPSVFVVYPEIESKKIESLAALERIPGEDTYWKAFFKHPNGAKKVTNIIINAPSLDLNTETVKAVNNIKNTTIKKRNKHVMELYFDNNIQGKTFDLRPELPLIIYL